jgi:hypothetical protein
MSKICRTMDVNLPFTTQQQELLQQGDLKAMDFYLGVGIYNGTILSNASLKAVLREEILMLRDELSDWPTDGSFRKITYREVIRQSSYSYRLVERTQSMTKQEVVSLVAGFESLLNEL